MTRLFLHDSLTTANLVEPLRLGWVEHDLDAVFSGALTAAQILQEDFALIPSPEITLLVDTHQILTQLAVVDEPSSAIALRTPVRPDDIEQSNVVLYETSATAEVLARALLWPFFGIETSGWTTEPESDAQITVVEGALALQDPEAGHSLDLGRSWYVMTGMPLVTHLLAAPREAAAADWDSVVNALQQSATEAHARRRELRLLFDERFGVERERLVEYQAGQRHQLGAAEREALVALLVRGAGGSRFLPLTRLPFADEAEAGE